MRTLRYMALAFPLLLLLTGCALPYATGFPMALVLALLLLAFSACRPQIDDDRLDEALLRTLLRSASDGSSASSSGAVCSGSQDYTQSFDLSSVDPAAVGFGFRIDGESGDYAGYRADSAGDFNGDGFGDILVAAPYYNGMQGAVYVIFGRDTGFANIDLTNVHSGSSDGIRITRESWSAGGLYFTSARGVGDVNGDGFDDILLGGQYGSTMYDGRAYLIFGKASPSDVDTSSMSVTEGVRLLSDSANWLYAGVAAAGPGDVNGDGFDDMVVSATYDNGGAGFTGRTYVIYGKSSWGSVNFNLANVGDSQPDADGFLIDGAGATDKAGAALSAAGDVNNDGIMDIFVGAPNGNDGYVIYGASGTRNNIALGSLGGDGFTITGMTGYTFGDAVSAGDFNGDGQNDLAISDWLYAGSFGRVALVYGENGATSLDSLGSAGFFITGSAAYRSGISAAANGDINGDGFDDLLIGSTLSDYSVVNAGSVHVVFGSAAGLTDSTISTFTNGTAGFRIDGAGTSDGLGNWVSYLSDVNGDACDDIVLGTRGSGNQAYVIFGGRAQ